jgi:hypothetical protein
MTNNLEIIRQRTVQFYDDELVAIQADDGQVYVSIRQMCTALGLDTQGQTRRIKRQTVLEDGYKGVDNLDTPGGPQRAYVLRVDLVPLWLSGIRAAAVKDTIRPKLEKYQREAAKVLWEAFQEGRLTGELAVDDLLAGDSPAAQAYKMASAIMQMARHQLLLESQIEEHAHRLQQHRERLEMIESTLGDPGRTISPDQATQISQAVKAVAMELGKQTKRNEYGGVYGELYRRYRIPSYRELPATKYEDAIGWLGDWLQSLTGDEPF